jgi:purine-binding chemotaxis protein CheW
MSINEHGTEGAQNGDVAQYLTFLLDGQVYGVPIVQVQEIRGWMSVTPLPNSPAYIKGVLNLRGTIIPVIDLRVRFKLPFRPYDTLTVIVVVNIRDRLAGLVVDSVSDVIDAGIGERRETPTFEGQVDRRFIEGLLEAGQQIVIVLNTAELDDSVGAGDSRAA